MGYKYNPFTGTLDIVSSSGGSGSEITQIDTDSGSAVPVANIINLLGSGSLSTSASGNTITITDGLTSLDFLTDSGTAAVALNEIEITGGSNMNTSGTSNIVTVNLNDDITIDSLSTSDTVTGLSISGNLIAADGTDTNIPIEISPKGGGAVIFTNYPAHSVMYVGAGSALTTSTLTDGQLLIGSTGVSPQAANITSTGGSITVSNGAGTINLEAGGSVLTQFDADSGSATPSGGVVDFFGSGTITTVGSGNTLTIDGVAILDLHTDSGTATEDSLAATIAGGSNINTSGTGSTVTVNLDADITVDSMATSDATAGLTISGQTIAGDGTSSLVDIILTPKGAAGKIIFSNYTEKAMLYVGPFGQLDEIGPLTNGQLIIGSTGANPVASTLSSSAGSIDFVTGAGTLNLEVSPDYAREYETDSGTVVADAGTVIITGAGGITTSGSGETITITGTGAADLDVVTDSGTATSSADSINLFGGTNINTSGTGATITVNLDADITVDSMATSAAAAGLTISGQTIAMDGTDTNINLILTPKGSGTVNFSTYTANRLTYIGTSGAVTEYGAMTDGQLLLGSTGAAPAIGSLSSVTGSIEFTPGAGSLILEVSSDYAVDYETDSGTAVADTKSLVLTGAGGITTSATGNVITITGSSSSDLDFVTDSGTATSSGSSINMLGGTNLSSTGTGATVTINMDADITVDSLATSNTTTGLTLSGQTLAADGTDTDISIILTPKGAGTVNLSTYTSNRVLYVGSSGALTEFSAMTNGQLLIGSTGAAPSVAALASSGSTIAITNGAGTINLETGSAVATSFSADTGSAAPSSGVLTVTGAGGISTSGSGSTLTITGTVPSELDVGTDSGTATSVADTLNILGGTNINTAGALNNVTINLDSAITITSMATDVTTSGLTISGQTIAMDGTDTNISLILTPKGSGTVNLSTYTANRLMYVGTSGALTQYAAMTNGQILIGSTGTFPAVGSLASSGSTIAITPGAGSINLETGGAVAVSFDGDTGTAVPSSGSITLEGSSYITTSASGHTVTFDITSDVLLQLDGDTGSATPTTNAISIVGAGSVTTSATGSTLTITGASPADLDFVTDSGTATSSADSINMLGGTNINTSGTGASVTVNLDSAITVTSVATDTTTAGLTISGQTIAMDGTDTDINLILTPKGSGTVNLSTYTQNTLLYVGASGALTEIGPLTDGQLIIGDTSDPPAAAALASAGSTISITNGAGTINLETGSAVAISAPTDSGTATPSSGALTFAGGTLLNTSGSGSTVTINADSTVVSTVNADSGSASGSTNAISIVGAGSVSTSATGSTITITGSGGGGGTSWSVETGTTNSIAAGEGVFCNNASGVTVTLPATAAIGDTFQVVAMHSAGFVIDYSTGQSIVVGNQTSTTTTGDITSSGVGDWVEIVCNVTNTGFIANIKQGNVTVN